MPGSARSAAAVIVLPLGLGALTTVALAWVLALRLGYSAGTEWSAKDQSWASGEWSVRRWHPPPVLSGSLPAPDPSPRAVRLVLSWWGHNDHLQSAHVAFDTLTAVARGRVAREQRRWEALVASAGGRPPPFKTLIFDARGWPYPALACEWRSDRKSPETLALRGGIALSDDPSTPYPTYRARALPLLPLWPGFVLDTALWAALWAALLLSPRATRRLVRARRRTLGRCTKCRYDRRGLGTAAPCPECGEPAPIAS